MVIILGMVVDNPEIDPKKFPQEIKSFTVKERTVLINNMLLKHTDRLPCSFIILLPLKKKKIDISV